MRTILPTILTTSLLLSGCSFIVGKDGKPCEDTEDCGGKQCVAGVCVDEQACTDGCDFEGQLDCDPYAPIIVTCSRNADTCLNWIPEQECGGENKCVEGDPPTCQPGCKNMCDLDQTECVHGSSAICIDGQHGCLVWYEAVDCEQEGQTCQAGRCFGAQGTCDDQLRNQDETDVDCGGTACEPCIDGKTCHYDVDCASEDCLQGTCSGDPTCDDSIKNQDETDTDCGGETCPPCANGLSCSLDRDCQSGTCTDDICGQADHCSDGQINEDETDEDCGGSCGATCAEGQTCLVDGDCLSGYCPADTCQPTPLSRSVSMPSVPELGNVPDDARAVDFMAVDQSSGDHLLATGSAYRTPRVWHVPGDPAAAITQVQEAVIDNHMAAPVASVAFQTDGLEGGTYLFSADDSRGAYRTDASDWSYQIFHNLSGTVVAVPPDSGQYVAAGHVSSGASAQLVDIWDGQGSGGFDNQLATLDLGAEVDCLAFSPLVMSPTPGFLLAAGSRTPTGGTTGLKVWHSSDWESPLAAMSTDIPVLDVAFSSDGLLLGYVFDHPDNPTHFGIIDLSDWNSTAGIEIADLASIVFVPGKPLAFAATSSGVVFPVCDRGSGWQERSPVNLWAPNPIHDLAVSPDGKWLAAGGQGQVLVFSVSRLAEENGCDDL